MIKLKKTQEPQVLIDNGADWLQTLLDKEAVGDEPTEAEKTRYRHPNIKTALVAETNGKCAYCESKIMHVTFGDVEHVTPKSHEALARFTWSNLTLACDRCNTYKGSHIGLVDPYIEDPALFLQFLGPMVVADHTLSKSTLTEKTLRLNRQELIERRAERLRNLSDQLLSLAQTQDPDLREVLRLDIVNNETGDDVEFAAVSRSFLAVMLPLVGSTSE